MTPMAINITLLRSRITPSGNWKDLNAGFENDIRRGFRQMWQGDAIPKKSGNLMFTLQQKVNALLIHISWLYTPRQS